MKKIRDGTLYVYLHHDGILFGNLCALKWLCFHSCLHMDTFEGISNITKILGVTKLQNNDLPTRRYIGQSSPVQVL